MTEIALLKLAHVLGLVYWLGGDLGVFYSSFILCDDNKSPDVRVSAAKTLFALDQSARISMPLMLALGVHLAARLGYLPSPGWLVPAVWTLSLAWLAMVLALHFLGHGRDLRWLTGFDFWFRALLALGLALFAVAAYTGRVPGASAWAGLKLGIFAALIACGLAVRLKLKPFPAAFARLVAGQPSTADNEAIRRSIGGTRPFVLAIWVGLVLSAALGVHLIQPT